MEHAHTPYTPTMHPNRKGGVKFAHSHHKGMGSLNTTISDYSLCDGVDR